MGHPLQGCVMIAFVICFHFYCYYSIFKRVVYFMCIGILPVFVCAPNACSVQGGEGIGSPETGITDHCEAPWGAGK